MLMHRVNECVEMLWVSVWINAMAEVRDVATSAKLLQHFFHQF